MSRDGRLSNHDPPGHRRLGGRELAAQTAVELANETGSELHVVCVEEVPVTAGVYAAHGVPTPVSEEDQEVLDEQVRQIEGAGETWRNPT